jgi:hypothetical protein
MLDCFTKLSAHDAGGRRRAPLVSRIRRAMHRARTRVIELTMRACRSDDVPVDRREVRARGRGGLATRGLRRLEAAKRAEQGPVAQGWSRSGR